MMNRRGKLVGFGWTGLVIEDPGVCWSCTLRSLRKRRTHGWLRTRLVIQDARTCGDQVWSTVLEEQEAKGER